MRVRITGGPWAGQEGEVVEENGRFVTLDSGVEVHCSVAEPVEDEPAEVARTVIDVDLKPRGVKRQWWLMPLDALAAAIEDERTIELPLSALGAYQREPSAEAMAGVVRAGCAALARQRECGLGEVLDLVVQVFEHGAAKYSPDNWRHAAADRDAFRREYLSALGRHLFPADGATLDQGEGGSGLPHLAHFICTALMMLSHELETFR